MKQRYKGPIQLAVLVTLVLAFLVLINRQFRFIGHHDSGVFPAELLLEANGGRDAFGADGDFAFPSHVDSVVVDVGAHHLQVTGLFLIHNRNLGLIAIEPQPEAWRQWPIDIKRLIALPVAIDQKEGMMDFHVNVDNSTSSLLASRKKSWAAKATRTVEVRKVHVFRLERVLEKIPKTIAIMLIKVDVQGKDLQVLKSAGDLLERARQVRTEVFLKPVYKGTGADRPGTEKEFIAYMNSKGFRLQRRLEVYANKGQEDLMFINNNWRK